MTKRRLAREFLGRDEDDRAGRSRKDAMRGIKVDAVSLNQISVNRTYTGLCNVHKNLHAFQTRHTMS